MREFHLQFTVVLQATSEDDAGLRGESLAQQLQELAKDEVERVDFNPVTDVWDVEEGRDAEEFLAPKEKPGDE